jgi:hypothetical protein
MLRSMKTRRGQLTAQFRDPDRDPFGDAIRPTAGDRMDRRRREREYMKRRKERERSKKISAGFSMADSVGDEKLMALHNADTPWAEDAGVRRCVCV